MSIKQDLPRTQNSTLFLFVSLNSIHSKVSCKMNDQDIRKQQSLPRVQIGGDSVLNDDGGPITLY